ncbi:hypothetical protein HNP55_003419 [Paucibacter oligotrophus]|uniref:PAS fold-3 domain-containing protein n=1 Tax=Roseateles oligotrophus TaxID=1769250 RepID=A0A840LDY6_9BURK|nr:hypothetical protein [Roseateles oligotrophus]
MAAAVARGELGLWDLRHESETVQHSPQWKSRLGFPEPQRADSTHFWRCRVHPEDLDAMTAAMLAHARGELGCYEACFRLRSNGSGYRLIHSRGRVVLRNADGRALRMVGAMIDLTDRPLTPRAGLPDGLRDQMGAAPLDLPFHQLLSDESAGVDPARLLRERAQVLGQVEDLLQAAMAQLGRA